MTEVELKRCKSFLDYFEVKYEGPIIYLTDKGNSDILNPNTEWSDFSGYTINQIAELVAKELHKEIEWKH